MLVKVKLLTGTQTEIDIDSTDTIARIKERVEEKDGIDPRQQRLIFGGKQLADDKRADEYNIGAWRGGSFLEKRGRGWPGGNRGREGGAGARRSSAVEGGEGGGGDRWLRLYSFCTLLAVRTHSWLTAAVEAVGEIHGCQALGIAPSLLCVCQSAPPQLPTRPRRAAGFSSPGHATHTPGGHYLPLLLVWALGTALHSPCALVGPPPSPPFPPHPVPANGLHADSVASPSFPRERPALVPVFLVLAEGGSVLHLVIALRGGGL